MIEDAQIRAVNHLRAPDGGWRPEDLEGLPSWMPEHVELVDGVVSLMPPQSRWHSHVTRMLWLRLEERAPPELSAEARMTVMMPPHRPEPDVLLVSASAAADGAVRFFPAEEVALAVEVAEANTSVRDRERKPQLYAQAGIPHFWRVEADGDDPVVFVHERDPASGTYGLVGIFRDRLVVSCPLPLALDLATLVRCP